MVVEEAGVAAAEAGVTTTNEKKVVHRTILPRRKLQTLTPTLPYETVFSRLDLMSRRAAITRPHSLTIKMALRSQQRKPAVVLWQADLCLGLPAESLIGGDT